MRFLLPSSENLYVWINSAVMIVGLYTFGWRAETVIFAYLFESILLGVLQPVKLYASYRFGNAQRRLGDLSSASIHPLLVIPFNTVVYFLFIAMHSVFMFAFMMPTDANISNPLDLPGNFNYLLRYTDTWQAFLSITISTLLYTLNHFFLQGRYHRYTVNQLLAAPYARITIQQAATIASGWLFLTLGGIKIVALVLVAARFLMDNAFIEARKNRYFRTKLLFLLGNDRHKQDSATLNKSMDALLDV